MKALTPMFESTLVDEAPVPTPALDGPLSAGPRHQTVWSWGGGFA